MDLVRALRVVSVLFMTTAGIEMAHAQPGTSPKRLAKTTGQPASLVASPEIAPTFASTGANPCILLTGYWPPSNEAIRRFSPSPSQNPAGWIGQDWENRGYDVYSYFPEFSPPTCTSCGTGTGDLEVDYQDTSVDFWNIANAVRPIAIITFSRSASSMNWEVEMNQYNRATWINDYVNPKQPTPAPPDASVPAETLRRSSLPVQQIVNDVTVGFPGLNTFVCFTGNGGGFLSEFMAYHGVWYRGVHQSPTDPDWCVAAGHIHVGKDIPWPTAIAAAEISLRTVIQHVDAVRAQTVCQIDLGSAGPGPSELALCGDALASGGVADLLLHGAPAVTPIHFFAGAGQGQTPLGLGTFVPTAPLVEFIVPTDAEGRVFLPNVPGGGGPVSAYLQAAYPDAALPGGIGLSNALKVDLLP